MKAVMVRLQRAGGLFSVAFCLLVFSPAASAFQIPTGPPPPPPPPPGEQQRGNVVQLDTQMVTVSFTATDKDGKYVLDLRPEEVKVFEEKKEQKIDYFHYALLNQKQTDPTLILVLLDQSTSVNAVLQKDAEVAGKFIDALPENAVVAVCSFGESLIVRQMFTRDRQALVKAFLNTTRTPGSVNLFQAVASATDILNRIPQLERGKPNRKVLIVVSDGIDSNRSVNVDGAVTLASATGVKIHTIQMRSALADSSNLSAEFGRTNDTRSDSEDNAGDDFSFSSPGVRTPGGGTAGGAKLPSELGSTANLSIGRFRRLSGDTGGIHYTEARSANGLAPVLTEIATGIRSEYVIGYQPADTNFNGKFRKIEVKVTRPDVKVKGARRGYFASKEVQLRPDAKKR